MRFFIYFPLLLFLFLTSTAQEGILTVGFQFKPIVPVKFSDSKNLNFSSGNIDFSVSNRTGFCGGMVVRRGFTKSVSFETGINYTKRNFLLSLSGNGINEKSKFAVINYEIPVMGLVFIRLGEKIFMNSALGVTLDIFPSDVFTSGNNFFHYLKRKGMFLSGLSANIGYEYRTENTGYFYLGASYHRPWKNIYVTFIDYNNNTETATGKLYGNYLTFDIRYFFNEIPLKAQQKQIIE